MALYGSMFLIYWCVRRTIVITSIWYFTDDKLQTPVVDETNEFVADEKDLESDEALWALYERWCKHFNQECDRDEMARVRDYP
jgi:putative sterol carrier protein